MYSDPIADFLTRIRNASRAEHEKVDIPSSKLKLRMAEILKDEGFIKNFRIIEDNKQGTLRVYLKYVGSEKIISGIVRVVLTIDGVKDYTASLLTNPPQLVIDLYPDTRGAAVRAAKAKHNSPPGPIEEPSVDGAAAREERSGVQAVSTAATRVEPFGPPASAEGG